MTFVHYGADCLSKEKFLQPKNYLPTKPIGGLWCSPFDKEFYSWIDWCTDNDHYCNFRRGVKFELPDPTKLLKISSLEDYENLITFYGTAQNNLSMFRGVDWQRVSGDYDAVLVLISVCSDLYWKLYGWDCDTLWICNSKVLEKLQCEKI